MDSVSIADAQMHLSELVDRVEAGETIEITRDGRTVARLEATNKPSPDRRKVDVASLRALTDSLPYQEQSAGDFIRAMRDSDRY